MGLRRGAGALRVRSWPSPPLPEDAPGSASPRPSEGPQARHTDPLLLSCSFPRLQLVLRKSLGRKVRQRAGRKPLREGRPEQELLHPPLRGQAPSSLWASVSPYVGKMGSVGSPAPPAPNIQGPQNFTFRASLCHLFSVYSPPLCCYF